MADQVLDVVAGAGITLVESAGTLTIGSTAASVVYYGDGEEGYSTITNPTYGGTFTGPATDAYYILVHKRYSTQTESTTTTKKVQYDQYVKYKVIETVDATTATTTGYEVIYALDMGTFAVHLKGTGTTKNANGTINITSWVFEDTRTPDQA